MRRRLGWVVLLVGLTARTPRAEAQAAHAPSVWYRAAEKCPAGPEFLEKLGAGQGRARLAGAGDHIDFVVTLLSDGAETVGRLERQTNGGAVAIRELRDASCDRVADALALSLTLALDPAQAASEPSATSANDAPATGAPTADALGSAKEIETARAGAQPAPSLAALLPSNAPPALRRPDPVSAPPRWFVGLNGGAQSGLATRAAFIGQAFVDSERVLPRLAPDLALRFAALGLFGSTPTTIGSVYRWILAVRSELCPVRWGNARFGLRPCVAIELGMTGATREGDAALADRGLWLAPGAELRSSFAVASKLRLEAGAGGVVPLRRDEVFVGARPLYRDAIIGVRGTLGVSLALP